MKTRLRLDAMTGSAIAGWLAVIAHWSGPLLAQNLDLSWIAHERLKTGGILVEFGDDRRFGNKVYYGEPHRLDILRAARVDACTSVVVAIADPEESLKTGPDHPDPLPARQNLRPRA